LYDPFEAVPFSRSSVCVCVCEPERLSESLLDGLFYLSLCEEEELNQ